MPGRHRRQPVGPLSDSRMGKSVAAVQDLVEGATQPCLGVEGEQHGGHGSGGVQSGGRLGGAPCWTSISSPPWMVPSLAHLQSSTCSPCERSGPPNLRNSSPWTGRFGQNRGTPVRSWRRSMPSAAPCGAGRCRDQPHHVRVARRRRRPLSPGVFGLGDFKDLAPGTSPALLAHAAASNKG